MRNKDRVVDDATRFRAASTSKAPMLCSPLPSCTTAAWISRLRTWGSLVRDHEADRLSRSRARAPRQCRSGLISAEGTNWSSDRYLSRAGCRRRRRERAGNRKANSRCRSRCDRRPVPVRTRVPFERAGMRSGRRLLLLQSILPRPMHPPHARLCGNLHGDRCRRQSADR